MEVGFLMLEECNTNYEEDFYGRGSEEVKVEIKGITDEVVNYTYTHMSYPCIVMKEGFKCAEHKMVVLSKMVKMSSTEDKDITLYFSIKGELYKVGKLSGSQMKAFVDIVGLENARAFYSEDKELIGDKMYVLCA